MDFVSEIRYFGHFFGNIARTLHFGQNINLCQKSKVWPKNAFFGVKKFGVKKSAPIKSSEKKEQLTVVRAIRCPFPLKI